MAVRFDTQFETEVIEMLEPFVKKNIGGQYFEIIKQAFQRWQGSDNSLGGLMLEFAAGDRAVERARSIEDEIKKIILPKSDQENDMSKEDFITLCQELLETFADRVNQNTLFVCLEKLFANIIEEASQVD